MRLMDLKLADAKVIIENTLAAQAKNGFKPMAVVVLGSGGTIKASESQDGTSLLRPKVAHGKAYGAISMGIGSRVLVKNKDGDLIGAVGVTGDTSDNDETCAIAGIEAAGFIAQVGA